eukprot:522189-Prorocentrum_minimum.AAC.1
MASAACAMCASCCSWRRGGGSDPSGVLAALPPRPLPNAATSTSSLTSACRSAMPCTAAACAAISASRDRCSFAALLLVAALPPLAASASIVPPPPSRPPSSRPGFPARSASAARTLSVCRTATHLAASAAASRSFSGCTSAPIRRAPPGVRPGVSTPERASFPGAGGVRSAAEGGRAGAGGVQSAASPAGTAEASSASSAPSDFAVAGFSSPPERFFSAERWMHASWRAAVSSIASACARMSRQSCARSSGGGGGVRPSSAASARCGRASVATRSSTAATACSFSSSAS